MKKYVFYLVTVLLVTSSISCNSRNEDQEARAMNANFVEKYNNLDLIEDLSYKVLMTGDTIAFRELEYIYMISENSDEFLYFSTVMAEKYNYAPAYQTNWQILKNSNERIKEELAIYNLLRSYELGNKRDIDILIDYFPSDIPKSDDYLKHLSIEKKQGGISK